jgi:AcrR family transcriptional regulator
MARWEPDSAKRLAEAAYALYGERGYENTTVAEIAKRAGLTERTFFRHFADKREVLFAGSEVLMDTIMAAVAGAPASLPPLDAVAAGLEAAGTVFPERPDFSRRRQVIIDANPELRERELRKMANLSAALTEALRARGVSDAAASLTAEVGVALFRTAFGRWIDETNKRGFAQVVRESLDELKSLAAAV